MHSALKKSFVINTGRFQEAKPLAVQGTLTNY
jgi:hypothetical protein